MGCEKCTLQNNFNNSYEIRLWRSFTLPDLHFCLQCVFAYLFKYFVFKYLYVRVNIGHVVTESENSKFLYLHLYACMCIYVIQLIVSTHIQKSYWRQSKFVCMYAHMSYVQLSVAIDFGKLFALCRSGKCVFVVFVVKSVCQRHPTRKVWIGKTVNSLISNCVLARQV